MPKFFNDTETVISCGLLTFDFISTQPDIDDDDEYWADKYAEDDMRHWNSIYRIKN